MNCTTKPYCFIHFHSGWGQEGNLTKDSPSWNWFLVNPEGDLGQDYSHYTRNVSLDQEKAHFSLQMEVNGHDHIFTWERKQQNWFFCWRLFLKSQKWVWLSVKSVMNTLTSVIRVWTCETFSLFQVILKEVISFVTWYIIWFQRRTAVLLH